MILFFITIVFIAQLIITTVIVVKLLDFDLAVIDMDERLKARQNIIKYSLYYLKEITASYKELTDVTFQNLEKKYRKSKLDSIKATLISLAVSLLPKPARRFVKNTKRGYKIVRYLSTP